MPPPTDLERMHDAGCRAGRAAGSWALDGNSTDEQTRAVLAQSDDCELEIPAPDIDDYEPIFEDADCDVPGLRTRREELLDAWVDGYREGYEGETCRAALAMVGEEVRS